MKKKIRVGILFGGKSAEHEVSLRSAKNVIDAIDKDKYEVVLVGLDKAGRGFLGNNSQFLLNAAHTKQARLNTAQASDVALLPESAGALTVSGGKEGRALGVDVVFPILHGPFGEDGTVQGLLKLADVPFVGASVLGSAVGMDKDVMKRLLRDARIAIPKFLVFRDSDEAVSFEVVKRSLGVPFFVKPANLGSSVGVSKVKTKADFEKAITEAFQFDRKILIEENIVGREIECSVLGNDNPIASVPGEIILHDEFYSYDAKYIDEHGAELKIPAELPENLVKEIQKLAVKTFVTLACEGLARVDFFLTKSGKGYVNEINTIPGFTSISMYPKLWEASGISYKDLIDKLIGLAIERHQKEKKLKTSYQ